MTFKTFEKITAKYRPDVIVSRHGAYCNNNSNNTLGIVFVDENGRQSRVYDYSGSYQEVLQKLGISAITRDDVVSKEYELEYYKTHHGEAGFFSDEIADYSEEIRKIEEWLQKVKEGKFVNVWDFE